MIPGTTGHPHKVILAASGTRTDLEAAETKLLAAFPEGGTVQIPTGEHLWTGVWNTTDIVNIQGKAGAILTKNDSRDGFDNPMIGIVPTAVGRVWRCRGFKMTGNWTVDDDTAIYPQGSIDMRIYNMELEEFGRAAVQTRGNKGGTYRGSPRGVIWDNTFTDCLNLAGGSNTGYGIEVVGDENDNSAVVPGSEDMLYIEDNTFTRCRHAVASNNNNRHVCRNNDIYEQRKNAHALDMHGKAAWPEGGRWVEWYDNTVHSNQAGVTNSNYGMNCRGGGGVIFGNELNNGIANGVIKITIEGWSGLPPGDQAYPTPYQTGDLENIWAWDNNYQGNSVSLDIIGSGGGGNNLVEGRDYFNFAKPGYTAATYPHKKRNAL